ncbi:MAG: FIST N-terminal domain-containing protein [Spirochaetota bacterium]
MLKAKVGSSIAPDAITAGKEAASKAALDGAQLALVFSSCAYDQAALLSGVKAVLPGASTLGCTSYTGVLTPEGFITGPDGYVAVMAMKDEDMKIGAAGKAKAGSARETGKAAAKEAMANAGKKSAPAFFYMIAPPGEEESYLKGVEDVIGRVPFFGGSAADNSLEGKWKVLFGNSAMGDGVALAFFYTDKPVASYYGGEYEETPDYGVITKLRGKRTIVEIDGVPALKKYASLRGVDPDSLKGFALLGDSICHPLGIKDRLGDLTAIRHPMVGNDDYSMNLGSDLAEKTTVLFMKGDPDGLIASAGSGVGKVRQRLGSVPGAYVLVHCGGRRGGIGDRMDEAHRSIKAAAGNVPFIGVFTFGEYGYEDQGCNTCGGLMLSYAAFSA